MNPIWMASYLALWLIVAAMVVVIVGFLRQLGLIQLRLGIEPGVLITDEGLARGLPAPEFAGAEMATGRRIRLGDYRGRRLVIVFLSTSCVACRKLVPHLNTVARDSQSDTSFLVICNRAEQPCEEFSKLLGLRVTMLVDPSNAIAASFKVQLTPFVFLIDPNGTILIRGVANTWPQLESLLREEGTVQQSEPQVSDGQGTIDDRADANGSWSRAEGALISTGRIDPIQQSEELSTDANHR